MMDSMIAKLRVALQLDSAAFESGTNRAAQEVNALGINMQAARSRMNAFSEGLIISGGNAQRMSSQMRAVNDNAGLMRAGLQNAGFQLQDMAVQFASGQRAGTILAQQLPQLSGAIAQIAQASGQTSGVVGRLASFLGGPWGVAVGVGTAVLSPFIAKLFETGDAAKEAEIKIAGFANILAKARTKPMEALGDARSDYFKEVQKLNRMKAGLDPNVPLPGTRNIEALRKFNETIAGQEAAVQAAKSAWEDLPRIIKNNESLFDIQVKAGRFKATDLNSGGGSPARRAGQDAGREYRSGLEDELRKLEQTTKDIEAKLFKPLADRNREQFDRRDNAAQKRVEAIATELRSHGFLPKGGRGPYAPDADAAQVAYLALAVAGADKVAEAAQVAGQLAFTVNRNGLRLIQLMASCIADPVKAHDQAVFAALGEALEDAAHLRLRGLRRAKPLGV